MTRRSGYLLPHAARGPGRRRGGFARADGAGGLIRQLAAGLWTYLPAGLRSLRKAEADHPRGDGRDRRSGNADAGAQPAEIWKQTGRYDIDELFKLKEPQGSRARAGDDARGEPDLPRGPRRPFLPRAAR